MAKRWYLSPVAGSGTEEDPFRPKVADYGVNHVAEIASKPDGTPRFGWCLVRVAKADGDFTALDADAALDGWPTVSLDTTVAQLPAAARNRLKAALDNRGIDSSDATGATTLRTILRRIGRIHNPRFHEDVVDCSE